MSSITFLGVDLGQREDYTAFAALSHDLNTDMFQIIGLKRLDLGTPYPNVIKEIEKVLIKLGKETRLVVDVTGVGRPIVDELFARGLRPIAISIHGGDSVTSQKTRYLEYKVPKRDLISNLQVLVQNNMIKINPRLKNAKLLASELRNVRIKINPKTAHDSYGAWREGEHDDLVLAVAVAAWYARTHRSDHSPFTLKYLIDGI